MGFYAVFAISLMVASSQALWFGRDTNRVADSNGRAVNETCLALADQGSCEFYTCFERRLSCGRDWYIVKHGQYYCNKMQTQRPNFSPSGQAFLDDAQRCMAQALKPQYQSDYVSCHDLEHHAVASITPCFIDNAFCAVFRDDAEHFFQIYEFSDLFTRGAGKIWRAITELTMRCGAEYLRDFSTETHNNVMESLNGIRQTLQDSVEELTD